MSDRRKDTRVPRPRNDQVVVKPLPDAEQLTNGGIIIPASEQKQNNMIWATVVDVGPGGITSAGERVPIDVCPGDTVGMRPGTGTLFMLHGEQYAAVPDGAIDVVLRDARS